MQIGGLFVASTSSRGNVLVGRLRHAEILSQRRLVNFPRRIARQRVDELDQPRAFEPRQIGLAMRVDLVGRKRMARLDRDDRHADFAPLLVRDADHSGFGNGVELMQHALDFGRIDVLAAGNVQVLPAIDDVVETLVVDARGVAGVQPAVGEG